MTAAAQGTPRRAGRPPRGVLSRELITGAAVALIAAEGYEGLTMSALARRLKVAPSALYNHASSKQEVLGWVQDHVMTMVDFSAFATEPWDEAVRRWAWSYREVFARHAPLVPVIAVMPVTDAAETLRMYEEVSRGFLAAGWPEERVVPAIVALESFIYGSALDVSAPSNIFDSGALGAEFPLFTSAVRSAGGHGSGPDSRRGGGAPDGPPGNAPTGSPGAVSTRTGNAADAAFSTGLEALITGLKLQVTPAPA